MEKKLTFEEAIEKLEETANKLEDAKGGLEDTVKLYEEGVKLASLCNKMIDEAQQKITVLSKSSGTSTKFFLCVSVTINKVSGFTIDKASDLSIITKSFPQPCIFVTFIPILKSLFVFILIITFYFIHFNLINTIKSFCYFICCCMNIFNIFTYCFYTTI